MLRAAASRRHEKMSEYKSEFLKTLSERGYLKQVTHPAEVDAYCDG